MSTEKENFVEEYRHGLISSYQTQCDELYAEGVRLQEQAFRLPWYKPFKKMDLFREATDLFNQAENLARFNLKLILQRNG